jgi:hypothetical protein
VIGKRYTLIALVLMLMLAGCSLKDRVIRDIPLQDADRLLKKYKGETAWTRSLLIDLGPAGIIDRDTKVEIVNLELHWTGAVTVKGPNNHKITQALDLERPLTAQAVEQKLNRLFWFKKPEYRYRMNLRKFGKKSAKAIYQHELFKGMKREAALESWGYPDEMNSNEVGGVLDEQWIYKDPRQKGKKRYLYIRDGIVDHWEE